MKRDEYARVLDYLPKGKSEVPPHKRKPLVQAVGDKYFALLELIPKPNEDFEQNERIYIGESERDKIDHIERRIKYDWLSPTAKSELPHILKEIVESNEPDFVDFYNSASSLSTRQHKLETLPKIGRRHREEILDEREIENFKSFEDMRTRLKHMPDPVKVIVDKIIEELKGESKYYLFTHVVEDYRRH
jgi:putative nucleotide binding protein